MFDVVAGWLAEKLSIKAFGENAMFVFSIIVLLIVGLGYVLTR